MIFRYWDQTALDGQLNARGTVPAISPFLKVYAEESARMRATLECRVNVPYGPTAPERLDFFRAKSTSSPIFVFIHGGYWRALDASDSSFMAQTFIDAGAAFATINYALAPDVSIDEIVRQCRAALAWIWRHAWEMNGDAARIHVCGSSAGGHLAGMMAAAGWHKDFGVPEKIVHSLSPLSGLHELEPVRLSNCNEWAKLDAASAARNSPLLHLPPHPIPMIISYGSNETQEFARQSEIYAAACAARGCPVEMICEPGSNHFDLPLRLMDRTAPLTRAVLRIMGLAYDFKGS